MDEPKKSNLNQYDLSQNQTFLATLNTDSKHTIFGIYLEAGVKIDSIESLCPPSSFTNCIQSPSMLKESSSNFFITLSKSSTIVPLTLTMWDKHDFFVLSYNFRIFAFSILFSHGCFFGPCFITIVFSLIFPCHVT